MIHFIVFVFLILAAAAVWLSKPGIALLALGYAAFSVYADRQLKRRDREWLQRPGSAQVRNVTSKRALEERETEAGSDKL